MKTRFILTPIAAATLAFGASVSVAQEMPNANQPKNWSAPGAGKDETYPKAARPTANAHKNNSNASDRRASSTYDKSASDKSASGGVHEGRIIGADVTNAQGQKVGEIEDVVRDRNGNLYAIVSTGGFLGMGEHRNAVPWHALQAHSDSGNYVLNVDKSRLSQAPAVDKGNYSELNDPQWTSRNNEYFGSRESTIGMDQGSSANKGSYKAYGTDVEKERMRSGNASNATQQGHELQPPAGGEKPFGSDVSKERMSPSSSNSRTDTTESNANKTFENAPYGSNTRSGGTGDWKPNQSSK